MRAGDSVVVLPAGRETRVKDVQLGGVSLREGTAEQSVTLVLEQEIDISRGDMIVHARAVPEAKKQIDAMVCWLAEAPLDRARRFLVRHTTRETKAAVASIEYRIDVNTGERAAATELRMNDIARVTFKLAQPVFSDPYASCRATGAFIVIDESTNNTVGAGMIV